MKVAGWLTTLLLSSGPAIAETTAYLNGVIVHVSDGDTATLLAIDDETYSIRFYGIDAPETENSEFGWEAQPFSREAKDFVRSMILNKPVSVRLKGDESYNRVLGEIFYDGKSVSREVTRAGLAWWNKKYEPHDFDIMRLATEAESKKVGLWGGDNPIPPWVWRKTKGQSFWKNESSVRELEALRDAMREIE